MQGKMITGEKICMGELKKRENTLLMNLKMKGFCVKA